MLVLPAAARAQTFERALAGAYATNPQLLSARQRLREVDENVPQALSGWRPRVSITGQYGGALFQDSLDKMHNPQRRAPQDTRLQVDQPLWTSGRQPARIARAEAEVRQERANLRTTEADVLLQAGLSYLDVVRDQRIVALNRNNVDVLQRSLRATRQQWQAGAVTLADVAQTEVRLAQAIGTLASVRAQATASEATFLQQIGTAPGILTLPEPRLPLPDSRAKALDLAAENNDAVQAARQAVDAAQRSVELAKAELRPQITAQGVLRRARETEVQQLQQRDNIAQGLVTVQVPIYQGGEEYSRIRQSREAELRAVTLVEDARRRAQRAAAVAWDLAEAAQIRLDTQRTAIRANAVALDGISREHAVGARTTLDVLNQQLESLNAEVGEVSARHDSVSARLQLGAALGHLTAEDLRLDVESFNPQAHYAAVRNKWFGQKAPDARGSDPRPGGARLP
jgi:outer membrane protein